MLTASLSFPAMSSATTPPGTLFLANHHSGGALRNLEALSVPFSGLAQGGSGGTFVRSISPMYDLPGDLGDQGGAAGGDVQE